VPAPAGSYDLYVSQRNEGAMEVAGLLVAEAQRAGVELTITSTPSEAHLARRFLLYLNDVTHDDSPALHAELEAALREKRPLLPVHEQRDAHGAVPFGEIMNRTPRDLLKLNIYSEIAVPLYEGDHQLASLYVLMGHVADGRGEALPGNRPRGCCEGMRERLRGILAAVPRAPTRWSLPQSLPQLRRRRQWFSNGEHAPPQLLEGLELSGQQSGRV